MSDLPTAISGRPVMKTIDDVLEALEHIIEFSIQENSIDGIFAYVYYRTTAKVKEGISTDHFEDNLRMEQFDVSFARKYVHAWWNFQEDKPVAGVWELAFSTTGSGTTIMQHILLGMNAHINLDLGIAAAEFSPGTKIRDLEQDFMAINEVLSELVDEVQERLSRVSPLMFLLDWVARSDDEAIVNFSITKARDCAWEVAQKISAAPEEEKPSIIADVDEKMSRFGRIVASPPGFITRKLLAFIRLFEEKHTGTVIEKLRL